MSQRPRGFVQRWNPRAETLALLEKVTGILAEYVRQLPLTIRQIFYRLVGRHGFEKTELAYSRLGETLNKARRARIVDMDAIRDDGFTTNVQDFHGSANHFFAAIQISAQSLRLDRQKGQDRRLALWCEAGGMVPQLARIADPYGIAVYSSGGFDSLTDKLAWRLITRGALRGFCTVELPSGLRIHDIPILVGAKGAAWATLPSKPQLAAGRHKLDANDRRLYVPVVEWITKDLRDRFSQAVVELVLAEHPSALDGEGGQ